MIPVPTSMRVAGRLLSHAGACLLLGDRAGAARALRRVSDAAQRAATSLERVTVEAVGREDEHPSRGESA